MPCEYLCLDNILSLLVQNLCVRLHVCLQPSHDTLWLIPDRVLGHVFKSLLGRIAETEVNPVRIAVVYSKVQACVTVICSLEDSLRTDCFRVLDVRIRPGRCHVKTAATPFLNKHDDYFRILLFRAFYANCIALFIVL